MARSTPSILRCTNKYDRIRVQGFESWGSGLDTMESRRILGKGRLIDAQVELDIIPEFRDIRCVLQGGVLEPARTRWRGRPIDEHVYARYMK